MSKEKEPVRSRRELRQAQGSAAEQASGSGYPRVPLMPAPSAPPFPAAPPSGNDDDGGADAGQGTSRSRRAGAGPVDAPAQERSSQIRARDRAALRQFKELSSPLTGTMAVLPSRRSLRGAQPDGAPGTGRTAVVGPGRAGTQSPVNGEDTARIPAVSDSGAHAGRHGGEGGPAAAGMSVQDALAARQALADDARAHVESFQADGAADPLAVDLEVLARQRELAERAAILNQRAAARERLAQESTGNRAGDRSGNRSSDNDPTTTHNLAMVTPLEFIRVPGVDHPVLRPPGTSHVPVVTRGQQRTRPAPIPPAPRKRNQSETGTAPGTDGRAGTKPPGAAGAAATPGPQRRAQPAAEGTGAPRRSRAQTLRQAEAVHRSRSARTGLAPAASAKEGPRVSAQPVRRSTVPVRPMAQPARSLAQPIRGADGEAGEMPPLPAGSAHGLEPLDAVTAGLGRAQRARLVQWLAVLLGALALIIGLTMIINGMSR
ncbi:MAG TPA: hypothetical protein VIG41_04335 [Micrococcaceae bacterium]